jgi:hypothetical protein
LAEKFLAEKDINQIDPSRVEVRAILADGAATRQGNWKIEK